MGARVMQRFLASIRQFGRDERGVFAVIFGLLAIVLVALSGAVVDYVSLEQARNRSQIALDAAALALQPSIFDSTVTREQIRQRAEALMINRIADPSITASIAPADVAINVDDGSLYLAAELEMPTIFVSLVGVTTMRARIKSEAARKKLALEVAFVLDNSGSMSTVTYNSVTRQNETRMYNLKIAATCATNIIFYGDVQNDTNCTPVAGAQPLDTVKMGVVPFTMYVNVGTANRNAAWIDATGASVIANDNFDNDDNDGTPFTGAVNRFTLFDNITNDDWRGRVEARPHIASGGGTRYLDTDDTPPTTGNTLFVPLFAPDLPDTYVGLGSYNNYVGDHPPACKVTGTCTWREVKTRCTSYTSCASNSVVTNTYTLTGRDKGNLSCTCSTWQTDSGTSTFTGSGANGRTYTRDRSCNNFQYDAQGLSPRELQERMCKYTGAISYTNAQKGPNADCPYTAVTPLTGTPATVRTAINNMVADGGTNIHEGTVWGFRALSPTVPFTEGGAYDEATAKILIIMTDGENTAYQNNNLNGSYYYSAYGYPYNSRNNDANSSSVGNIDRLGSMSSNNTNLVDEMNARTLQACANARAAGINIYTIGLATDSATQSSPTTVRNMLTECAGSSERAFFPAQPGELKSVFQRIASQLAALRLVQ